jgi:hypothetical protein
MALYLIRYKMDAERITARDCWCRDCQFIDACSGTVNVFFPSLAGITDDRAPSWAVIDPNIQR